MLKNRRIISAILCFSIILTSLFTAGIINASAKTSEDGKMLKVSASNKSNRNNFMLPLTLKQGEKYTISFDYYLSGDFSSSKNLANAFRIIALKTNNGNDDLKDSSGNFLDPDATAGRHSYSAEFNATYDYTKIGFTSRTYNLESLDIYIWNFKVTKAGEKDNIATGTTWENTTLTTFEISLVDYDGSIVGYDLPMYHMVAQDWKSSSVTLSNAAAGDYTVTFDYYNTAELDGASHSFALNTNYKNGWHLDEKLLKQGLNKASVEFSWQSQGDLVLELKAKYAEVYFWNVKLTKKGESENLIDNSALSVGMTDGLGVEKMEYDESVFINKADCLPKLLGAQIRVGTQAADEQKLRIAFDFSKLENAVTNNIDINEKGVIIVADNTATGMTAEEIVDKAIDSNYVKIDDLANDGKAYVTVSRNSIAAYGKRIAAVAYIKTDNGVYYSETASKSVMGVMKAIFGNDESLKTEKIEKTAVNNTLNDLLKKNVTLKKSDADAEYVGNTFKGYTGYDSAEITITAKSESDLYDDAKTITAATYFYVTQ